MEPWNLRHWRRRLSPCHGIIRSVLFQELGGDYGDVILFDGAPITYHTYGEDKVPVFPHLATLIRNRYQICAFAATQESPGQITGASDDLERDAIVYSHSENMVRLCASCWRSPDVEHRRRFAMITGRSDDAGRHGCAPVDPDPKLLELLGSRKRSRMMFQELEMLGLVDEAD